MKKLITLLLLANSSFLLAQEKHEIIWKEDFSDYQIPTGIEGENDGDTNTNAIYNLGDYPASVTKWTLDASNADLQNFADYAAVFRNGAHINAHLRVQDTGGDGISWTTETIDVSTHNNTTVSLSLQENGDHETSDYVDILYSIDGNDFIRIPNWKNFGNDDHTFTGNSTDADNCLDADWKHENVYFSIPDDAMSLAIKVTFKNGATSENFYLDDVVVMGQEDQVLSISDLNDVTFNTYPNPASEHIMVTSNKTISRIELYSITGQKVFNEETSTSSYKLPLTEYVDGVYFLRMYNGKQSFSVQKIIINKK